jgi:hypothetical protein
MWFKRKENVKRITIEDLIRREGREPGGIDLRPEMDKFLKLKIEKEPELHLVGGTEVEYDLDEELPEGIEPWNPPGETKGVEVEEVTEDK